MSACSCTMRELKIVKNKRPMSLQAQLSGRDKNFSKGYTNSKLEALLHDWRTMQARSK